MSRLRSITSGIVHIKNAVLRPQPQQLIHRKFSHHDGPPQPFDNMPFNVASRHAATVFFGVFFGLGLWAPYVILWYSMAKRTL